MEPKEFLAHLGITKEGRTDGSIYIVDLADSNDYARAYSALDKAAEVDLDNEASANSEHSSMLTFLSDDYDIILEANFDDNVYRLTVKEGN